VSVQRMFEIVTPAEWIAASKSRHTDVDQALAHLVKGEDRHVKIACPTRRLNDKRKIVLRHARKFGIFVSTAADPAGWLFITRVATPSTRGRRPAKRKSSERGNKSKQGERA
jgi:hypothetical protein